MHRRIDAARQQGFLDLLGEQALAADLGERSVLDFVAGGLDDHDLDRGLFRQFRMRGGQTRAHLVRLRQRQGAAARTQSKTWRFGHGTSLTA